MKQHTSDLSRKFANHNVTEGYKLDFAIKDSAYSEKQLNGTRHLLAGQAH